MPFCIRHYIGISSVSKTSKVRVSCLHGSASWTQKLHFQLSQEHQGRHREAQDYPSPRPHLRSGRQKRRKRRTDSWGSCFGKVFIWNSANDDAPASKRWSWRWRIVVIVSVGCFKNASRTSTRPNPRFHAVSVSKNLVLWFKVSAKELFG